MKPLLALAASAVLMTAAPAVAQQSSYTPSSVWQLSEIKVEPGQFENYMDYLSGTWRKIQEFGKQNGYVLSYHIWAVNSARKDEPDLILAIEYKDYVPNAENEAFRKKVEAMLKSDTRAMETASGARVKMRTNIGGMELQELKFR